MQFHRFLDDHQPEARALAIADIGGAMKALEQVRLVRRRYADALIAHLDQRLAVALGQQHRHSAPRGRVFHRVGEQIGENVAQQFFVQIHAGALELMLELNDMLLGHAAAQFLHHLMAQIAQIHRLRLELQGARLGLAYDQHIFDHGVHAFHGALYPMQHFQPVVRR